MRVSVGRDARTGPTGRETVWVRRIALLAIVAVALAAVASASALGAPDAAPDSARTSLQSATAPVAAVAPDATADSGIERVALDKTKWRWLAIAAGAGAITPLLLSALLLRPDGFARRLRPVRRTHASRAPPWVSSPA